MISGLKQILESGELNKIKEFILDREFEYYTCEGDKLTDSYEDLERALENSKTEKELRDGVELIYSKIKDVLTKEGLEEIPAKGEKFDPFKHEALMVANDENVENGYIIDELMKGYTLKGKVIKYSKVRVCKK